MNVLLANNRTSFSIDSPANLLAHSSPKYSQILAPLHLPTYPAAVTAKSLKMVELKVTLLRVEIEIHLKM